MLKFPLLIVFTLQELRGKRQRRRPPSTNTPHNGGQEKLRAAVSETLDV